MRIAWMRRLVNALGSLPADRDIEREIAFHVAERVDELRAQGVSADEAVRRARMSFGNPVVHAERTRDVDVAGWLDALLRSVRYAGRTIVRTRGFAATAVVTLAVGIGANTAMFSLLDTLLLRPPPFPEGDRLVRLRQTRDAETPIAPARLLDWARDSVSFAALSGYYVEDVSDTTGTVPERVRRAVVAPGFLQVWGIAPVLGRGFTDAEHHDAGSASVLISDRYWRTRFGARAHALGSAVRIDGRAYAVVGVMPASFHFPDPQVDLWWPNPTSQLSTGEAAADRDLQAYVGIGRLNAGVTPEQATADLTAVQLRLARLYPNTDTDVGVRITPYKETLIADVRASIWMLFGAVSALLLIACSNIAALLGARATHRQHEISIRFSLGASRQAVIGQLLVETTILAGLGAVAGIAVAASALQGVRALAPELPRLNEVVIDARVLVYMAGSTMAVALLCAVVPALRTTHGVASLSNGGRTQASARRPLQWWLVGVQIALSVTLLAAAGLLLRSVDALARVDGGFEPARILAFRVSASWNETVDGGRLLQRINGTLDELRALPGVRSAATSWSLPGLPRRYEVEFDLAEGRPDTEPALMAEWRTVAPGYFSTLGIELAAGELCHDASTAQAASQVMVNRTFAERYFRGRSVSGLHLRWEAGTQTARIVGVVGDARESGIDRPPAPTVYACNSAPSPFPWFLVATDGEPLLLANAVRTRLGALEPLRSVYDIVPLAQRIGGAYAQNRLRTTLLGLFAATALFLASIGLYGALSYVVGLRRREVGLRLALGAGRIDVVRQLVGRALVVLSSAAICGVALSLAANRLLSGMLYGVTASDPLTLTSVVGIVLAVGSSAALVPALRASHIDPIRVLREE